MFVSQVVSKSKCKLTINGREYYLGVNIPAFIEFKDKRQFEDIKASGVVSTEIVPSKVFIDPFVGVETPVVPVMDEVPVVEAVLPKKRVRRSKKDKAVG